MEEKWNNKRQFLRKNVREGTLMAKFKASCDYFNRLFTTTYTSFLSLSPSKTFASIIILTTTLTIIAGDQSQLYGTFFILDGWCKPIAFRFCLRDNDINSVARQTLNYGLWTIFHQLKSVELFDFV